MDADVFAGKAVRALERGRSLIVIGGLSEHFAVALHRLAPRLFYRVVRRIEPEYQNLRT
ncbi:hypothetical protein ACWEKT_19800 [Nocardia takedensis]|uniref:hypothetical protein n=1 Tax=Nocardia takedensis TaxID=259390 RepID=UPI0002F68865|nr:hypothetical protein [Nocardia takedensis]